MGNKISIDESRDSVSALMDYKRDFSAPHYMESIRTR